MPNQKMVFHVEWPGEIDAGIRAGQEKVTISFEYGWDGGPDSETIDFFKESLKNLYDGATVSTEKEYQKYCQEETTLFEEE